MSAVTLYFKVHIPYRLLTVPDNAGTGSDYFDSTAGSILVNKLADECYLPANNIILSLIRDTRKQFKVAYSISGTTLELLKAHRPDVVRSFRQLVKTGCVELLAETYYSSLSWLYSKKEFQKQVRQHGDLVKELFNTEPIVFRNTELIYNNELAAFIAGLGYKGILCEANDAILKGRSPNQVYAAPATANFGLLLRNVNLSDDIAFRFDEPAWNEHPLTAEKFASWIHLHGNETGNINVFLDYETFGIHKKAATGIFEFLQNLPTALLSDGNWSFTTPSGALKNNCPEPVYDVPQFISWEDKTRECCVWCENTMQNNMLKKVYSLENLVLGSGCEHLKRIWGKLQSADHFYYMSDTGRKVNDAYGNFNPFPSSEEAYKNYLNIITDFEIKLIRKGLDNYKQKKFYLTNTLL